MPPLRRVIRRFIRWSWNALAGLSLLLFVTTCVLWVRSYLYLEEAEFAACRVVNGSPFAEWHLKLTSGRDGLLVWRECYEYTAIEPASADRIRSAILKDSGTHYLRADRAGFGLGGDPSHPPLWPPVESNYFDHPKQRRRVYDQSGYKWFVLARYWLLAALTAAAPSAWTGGHIRNRALKMRRARSGRCPTCGYDLTGNESGVCPECGRPVGKGTV